MHIQAQRPLFISAIALVGAILFASGCDNPVEEDDHDHAEEVEGLALVIDGNELLRVEDAQVSDTLWVPLSGSTDEIDIEFLDHDGNEIHAEDLDEEFGLDWDIDDPDVASFDQQGDWSFELNGLVADTTSMTLELLHGDHVDFTTPDIPVVVR